MMDDSTLGGYLRKHERPPAFEGSDGAPYSAEVLVEEAPNDDGCYGGAVLFVRWSPDGDRPIGHVESPMITSGATPQDARDAVLALTLYRLKELLDAAIAVAAERPTW